MLHTAKVEPGQSVAVFGVGGVGLSALAAAAAAGADPIIAVDLLDHKLQFAKEFGATHTINASNADPVKAIREIVPGGVDYAMDAVGAPTTALQMRHGGTPGHSCLRCLGRPERDPPVPTPLPRKSRCHGARHRLPALHGMGP
ncbi:zinc-binding dehydrogenase [Streptomyces pristinaespiralis]|nr:zinc-binding dehydrogenase [Streptomyces pristinaespiralis]